MRDKASIVFVMAHACPLKCNFCCHTREVVGSKRITRAMIVDWMVRFASEPSVFRYCFTGGEPFLYLADIKEAVAQARKAGVTQPFHIVTAAQWAKDRAQVTQVLSELKDLGMDLIGLSYDHEHAKWVTREQMLTVIDVAAELGLRVNLNGVFWNVQESISALLPVDELPGRVRVTNYLAVAAGRAKQASSWPRRYDLPNERKYTCGKPGNYDVTIYPDGEVYPCCSGGMNIDAKLSCGNVNRDSAADVLRNVFTMFHARMVKEFGWGVLYALVEKEAPELLAEFPKFEDVDSSCEICRDLNVNLAEKLRPIYQKVEAEYARTRAEFEWESLDTTRRRKAKRRRFGDRLMSLQELLALLTSDQSARHDYLVGTTQIEARRSRDASMNSERSH
jgi:MoaA/NifB/PqqE/SkfB family radical SAM enzyme